ncbi:MAG: AsmA family protein, partial [bacterium]|nr:AsmA family protein [bacterium]
MRKKVFISLGILAIVFVGGLFLLVLNLEKVINNRKDFLLSRAEQAVGRTVTIEDIGVSVWGGLGIRLSNVTMSDDPAFSDKPFIEAKELQISVKILPLLKKQLEIGQVTLRSPVIRVIRDKTGMLNAMTLGIPTTESNGQPSPGERGSAEPAAAFAIALVNIDNGSLHFEDRMDGLNLRITQINSRVTDLDPTKPISLKLDAAVLEDRQNIRVEATGGPISPGMDPLTVPLDATIDVGPIEAAVLINAVPSIKESLPSNLHLQGPVTVSVTASGTPSDLKVAITIDATETSIVLESNVKDGKEPPPSFEKASGIPLTARSDVAVSENTITLTNTVLRMNNTEVHATATIDNSDVPVVTYHATADKVALADFVPPDPELPQPQVVKGLDLEGTLTLGEQPSGQGTIKSSSGTVGVVEYSSLTGVYTLAGKKATLENIQLQAYDGTLTGQGTVVLDPEAPSFELKTQARGCDVAQALNKIPSGLRKHLRGRANMDLTVSGKGQDWASVQPTISGVGLAELFDGALIDLNIPNSVLDEVSRSTGQNVLSQGLIDKYPGIFKNKDTSFKDLTTNFVIENGKIMTKQIKMN